MSKYDIVFFHPPRLFGRTSTLSQFSHIPMGLFSLASSTEEQGYQTKIVNLGLNPVAAEKQVRETESTIYGIDLHWAVHAHGAIELAQMCKRYHPNSFVVLGGFTATWFAKEILTHYPFIDCIVMGEAEPHLTDLVKAYTTGKGSDDIRGITYAKRGVVKSNPSRILPESLDDLDFTELSLLDDWRRYLKTDCLRYHQASLSSSWVCIARGCVYDCPHCGGGRSAYALLTGRNKPVFRSPTKVAEDIAKLYEQGVTDICLSHDPELAGREYWSKLLAEVERSGIDVSVYWESYRLPSKDLLQSAEKVFYSPRVMISPESPSDEVRRLAGRDFTNHEFFKAIDCCEELGIAVDVYFCPGIMPGETALFLEGFKKIAERLSKGMWTALIPPSLYTLDPNCLMAVFPERYGVTPLLRTFEDYRRICTKPNPIDYVGHETTYLSRDRMLQMASGAHRYLASLPPPALRVLMKPTDKRWLPPIYPTDPSLIDMKHGG